MDNVSGVTGKVHFDFTPVDEAARQKIQAGDFGQFQDVTIRDKVVSVKTDLAIFKFSGPQLTQPTPPPPSAYRMAGEALGELSMERNLTDIMEIMKLFHEVAMVSRKTAREVRHTEREKMIQAIHDQAQKIRDAALKTMIAGIISGAFQMAAGAVSIAGGIKGLKDLKGGGKVAGMTRPRANAVTGRTATAASDLAAKAQATTAVWQGWSQVVGQTGQLGSTVLTYFAALDQARQKELEADEKLHETHVQDETEWMQNMLEVMRDTRQKLEEVIRAQQDTMKSIIRNV